MRTLGKKKIAPVIAGLAAFLAMALPVIGQESDDDAIIHGLDKVAEILALIRSNYMELVDEGELVESGIRGMLYQLDPHSTYFSPEQARRMLIEQEGEYFGIGLTIGLREGEITVISPMENGPAARQGIRTGDVITRINGEPIAGQDPEIIARSLRGPEDTEVKVTIEREGLPRPFEVTITRAMISLSTVHHASMITPAVGYIRLVRFAQTSGEEVAEAIGRLKSEGMTGLVLDLRSNPGGDLEQAIAVADLFLDDGLIVYTQGLSPGSRVDYNSTREGTEWAGGLIVLINRGSASASEVVAGALQDQDRAILAGENSWGKGLVQTVMPLPYGAVLALTTARYFTPAGRLIQRMYSPGQFDQYFNPEDGTPSAQGQPARTSLGRIVYGGNGLQPDVVIEEPKLSPLSQQVLLGGQVFDFITHYLGAHPDTGKEFEATAEVMEQFRRFLGEQGVEIDAEQWRQDEEFLATRIKLETVTRIAGRDEGFRAVLPSDRAVQRAIGLMKQAEELIK